MGHDSVLTVMLSCSPALLPTAVAPLGYLVLETAGLGNCSELAGKTSEKTMGTMSKAGEALVSMGAQKWDTEERFHMLLWLSLEPMMTKMSGRGVPAFRL